MTLTGDKKRDYQVRWLAARRARIIELLGGRCARCGSTEQLEIDHIDPSSKDPAIRQGSTSRTDKFPLSWAWSRIEQELPKCQLLCDGCHNEKSKAEQTGPEHGTAAGYHARKCRCDACRAWMRDSKRDYRARKAETGETVNPPVLGTG